MNWIKVNGKWVEKSKIKSLYKEQHKELEKVQKLLINKIKSTNKNTNLKSLKKTVQNFENVQKEIGKKKNQEKQVACIIKGKGVVHMSKNTCKKQGKVLKLL
jgi:hypothetical protein